MSHTGSQQEGKGKLPGHKNYISSETLQKINRVLDIFTEQSKGMPPANPTARAINKLREQIAELEAKDPKNGLTIALLNQRRAELDKLIKQYASYQNPFRDTSQPMENPWPGTAPPPQGMHSNVPYQTPKSEYESEYESDDTEIPKSEYESEYESDTKIPKSEYESEYKSDDTETPHRQRYSESGDRRYEERQSSSRKRKRRRTHTFTPPLTPIKTRGQREREREQKKVKKEPKTPKKPRGPRGKGNMVQSWFNQ